MQNIVADRLVLAITKVVIENDVTKIEQATNMLSYGKDDLVLKDLHPSIVTGLNDFDCIYDYACINRLEQESLNQLTDWVAKNGTEKQKERFSVNIPYVDLSRLDGEEIMTEQLIVDKENRGQIKVFFSETEINELTEWAIDNFETETLYKYTLHNCCLNLRLIELAMIRKSIAEQNIEYLYKFAKNVKGAQTDLLELGMILTYESMPEQKQFGSVKYLFHFANEFESKKKNLIEENIKESSNLEYVAYQIIYGGSESILTEKFGDYQTLWHFSLSCKDFFEDKKLYEDYIEKAREAVVKDEKVLVKKK